MAFLIAAPAAAAEPAPIADASQVERGEYNSYVVLMKADPLVATEGDNLDSIRARNRGRQLEASHRQTMREAGLSQNKIVNSYVTSLNGFSARVTYNQALKLAADKDVARVVPDRLRQAQTDASPKFLGLDGGGGAWKSGLTGKGVVVGVIDTGIWPEHPSFADNGLPAPPVSGIPCEFGNTAHNPADAPFSCTNKLIGARQMLATYRLLIGADPDEFNSARDDSGHGTHTASTAAGNANVQAYVYGRPVGSGKISGIAPDAHVVAYKALGNLGGFSSDLAAAIDQAVIDGVNVINYSIGGGGGTLGADEIAFLFAADAGVFVATSAGNSGPGASTVGGPGDVPWLTTVAASTQERFIEGKVKLGNGKQYSGASITPELSPKRALVDAAALGNELCRTTVPFSAPVTGKIVLCKRGATGRISKGLAVYSAGGAGMILYNATDSDNLFTDTHWLPTVHVNFTDGSAIKAYIAAAGAGATAEIKDTNKANKNFKPAPSTTYFSSRGPTSWPDVIKPDVTAPGLQILAGYSPYPDEGERAGELFAAIAGTSMSSPHVAGLFALLYQAHPDWSAAMAKSALMTTAYQDVRDSDQTSQADPFDMGSGHVNLGNPKAKGSAFQPGLVYEADFFDHVAWICGTNPGVVSAGFCSFLVGAGYSTDPSDLNYPSIGVAEVPGSQTVTRTVTSVAQESKPIKYSAKINAPAGYTVSVSPSTFTVAPGDSVTFEVTITNNSAPLGAWRFGSLTWESDMGKHYQVRSPIAVSASELNVAPLVQESGQSGSGSVDVSFGYTGDYSAAAHGLIAATVTSDNVLQDVDQTFSPSDVGSGGANAHVFTLSNAGVFRIAMPPEATEVSADLDIFVYDPSNTLVAASTSGGTDELVSIDDPADGAWTVYVHGYSAPGGDSDYDLYTWQIPNATGGTLQIDSAPASATIGTTGTVDYSWTGATLGQWWFGAISHHGNGGALLTRTLVEVDNR